MSERRCRGFVSDAVVLLCEARYDRLWAVMHMRDAQHDKPCVVSISQVSCAGIDLFCATICCEGCEFDHVRVINVEFGKALSRFEPKTS